jgi:hypothetical protein
LTFQVRQCLPVFNTSGANHHALAKDPSPWIKDELVMTLGGVMSELQPEVFTVMVRNANQMLQGVECTTNRLYDSEFRFGTP